MKVLIRHTLTFRLQKTITYIYIYIHGVEVRIHVSPCRLSYLMVASLESKKALFLTNMRDVGHVVFFAKCVIVSTAS